MKSGYVEWVEPFGKLYRPVYSRMRIEDAVDEWIAGHPEVPYTHDQALNDFLIVNWADIVLPPLPRDRSLSIIEAVAKSCRSCQRHIG